MISCGRRPWALIVSFLGATFESASRIKLLLFLVDYLVETSHRPRGYATAMPQELCRSSATAFRVRQAQSATCLEAPCTSQDVCSDFGSLHYATDMTTIPGMFAVPYLQSYALVSDMVTQALSRPAEDAYETLQAGS